MSQVTQDYTFLLSGDHPFPMDEKVDDERN
jgi:hypothetical protein